ncbi:MAG: D-glycero-beta-D-manno-heptose 1-phosphate adenylyltransferase [Leptospiraceae bacterium]|nr:D-glycero-beta-D-manno-heptose 1-phosphate adenylyltransferase [Leptospiraceae bacterium]MCP5495568.1 D-glycero-beta-D-manno-heptose 1-phosphate adenylyltransferase [Leptospiraceae bacterium]
MLSRIKEKIVPIERVERYVQSLNVKPIVFTNGCFDILHIGHITYLCEARTMGNFLWIGINSDASVKILKGEERPIVAEMERATLVASLDFVDAVTIFSEDTPIRLLSLIKPNIHVKGGDYVAEKLPEYKTVDKYGGTVKIIPYVEGKSSSGIIQKIKSL